MREGPVLSTTRDFFGLRMDRDHAAAREGANVGASFFIEREIPSGDRAAQVADGGGVGLPPLRPVGEIVG